eukprot:CAMPEP_0117443950 /NCGR_PEP_ID=MMETSP0759-20121206/4976_1 /TAXON_ID=63605 /ORGANISM="Percolomonas cosmopolitus, Strain WS" /LENGTH=297 /DNA_ID=CAMNT_0005235975 /DNA_START=45 /DNA_END=938 /DNA_ORIENTATION=-
MVALTQSKKLYNGKQMPILGLGTFQATDAFELSKAIKVAVDQVGYRAIDTAEIYKNEEIVGKAISELSTPRDELFITSKCWVKNMQSKDSVVQACNETLKRLGLKYLDLYLLHWPIADADQEKSKEKIIAAWKGMEHLLAQGKCKSIGVSNFMVEHLKEFLPHFTVKPHVNQVEAHPHLTQVHLADMCKEKEIQITSYRTLGCGKCLLDPLIVEMATKYKRTPAQICLRWALQRGFCVIPKSVHQDRIIENAKIFDFELTEVDMDSLNGLGKLNLHYCPNPHDHKELVKSFFSNDEH